MFKKITVAYGDGIGPEIMESALLVLQEAKANLSFNFIEVGKKVYEQGYNSGLTTDAWQKIKETGIIFKAPITTPQGGGYKSLNVTLRKKLGLYANVRPVSSFFPFVATNFPKLDVVIIRENEEDLYAGIEYRHTHNVRESVKLISRTGCEKIVRYAFEYAVKNNRKKVTCFSKDNIMKFSDGIFHQVFNEIAKEYPAIANEHYIVDIGTARLATKPEIFDVIVTSNLFGDIISDVTAEISGSVGLAGSANIGKDFALFEAIHGSAPDIAGKNIANPSGLLNGAIMMLVHIGQGEVAALIENAWKRTLEDGVHTADIYNTETSAKKVGTKEFAEEVVKRLGQKPAKLKVAAYSSSTEKEAKNFVYEIKTKEKKSLVGLDVFIDMNVNSAHDVAAKINPIDAGPMVLRTISSKGLKLWPRDDSFFMNSDHWCCRFMPDSGEITHQDITNLLSKLASAKIDFIKVENLYNFDGKPGYSLAQGE